MDVSGLTMLVVEDNDFQRMAAVRLLEGAGVGTVLEAADGVAGLDVLGSLAAPPDIVLSDVDMPEMDGVEFLRHVAQGRLAKAVAVSSSLEPALLKAVESVAKAYGLQVLGVTEKPLTRDGIDALLARFGDQAPSPVGQEDPLDASSLRIAIGAGELQPWFQPKVEVATGRAVGVEALVRWLRPDGRVVGPGGFLPAVEEHGLIDALTDSVLLQACRAAAGWAGQGDPLHLSVNLSMASLDEVSAADRYVAIVAEGGLDPKLLTFEVTETAVARNAAHSLDVLTRLRLRGFGLSIDDFGTGYSSLSQLQDIPFTELKVDRSFVADVHLDPRRRAMAEAGLDLARKLGITAVAEGVEAREEWDVLAALGTDLVQGYFVAKPMPAAEVPGWCARWSGPDG